MTTTFALLILTAVLAGIAIPLGAIIATALGFCEPFSLIMFGWRVQLGPNFSIMPVLHGDGASNDTRAIQAMFDGRPCFSMFENCVIDPKTNGGIVYLPAGVHRITKCLFDNRK